MADYKEYGKKTKGADLADLGLGNIAGVHWNYEPSELVQHTLDKGMGVLTNTGALAVNTGEFTGRSPQDRFIVKDEKTKDAVWWGDINIPFDAEKFDALYDKITTYLSGKEVYARDAYVCAEPTYRLNLRVITEYPWSNMFAYNMFLRPTAAELESFAPDWSLVCAPGFLADPSTDGTRQHNFAVINFTKKRIIIGGTGYTGEMKKGIFSVLNFILPHEKNVFPMHCSANVGKNGDTAIFFGLSGTGKTTLSSDPERRLIGDDEHGWAEGMVFNFEGGCYAKTIDLSEESEPQIFKAIRFGALLENIGFTPGTNIPDYSDKSITENTRVSYPIHHIDNIVTPSVGSTPQNIFFLTCDAFGVLPPLSLLNPGQAMYHFISGYTAKVAGTEAGITEPKTVFSAGFGAPFLPLHPTKYAEMLGKKMRDNNVKVWLLNTGWTGGSYGVGNRIKLSHTRALITAALEGKLNKAEYVTHDIFGVAFPTSCEGVPSEILNPRNTWHDKNAYDSKANELAEAFVKNFSKFEEFANQEILAASPKVTVK